jgi:DNA-binding NarL/FixJ family response regulator
MSEDQGRHMRFETGDMTTSTYIPSGNLPGPRAEPIRVVIAEPQWLVRKGLVAVVEKIAACESIGEAATGAEAIDAVQRLRPTLLLLSLGVTDPTCTEVIKQLRQLPDAPRILVLSQARAEASAREALRAGCDGFIDKEQSGEVLEKAMREVMAGRPFLDPQMSRRLLMSEGDGAERNDALLDVLTKRERSVFIHIADGHTNRSAGEALHISAKTVEKHRALVMQKLRLRSAIDLRMLALDLGLIERPTYDAPAPHGAAGRGARALI